MRSLIATFGGTYSNAIVGAASNVAIPRIFRYITLDGGASWAVTLMKT